MQSMLGVREQMETFGQKVIRPFMPIQHQHFYAQLPFVFAGSIDQQGQPWASILCGRPGFMSAASDTELRINSLPLPGDPLAEVLKGGKGNKKNIGLLGVELTSRRRNRLSTHLIESDEDGFLLQVDQCFGNCPQYIQSRDVSFIDEADMPSASLELMAQFDEQAISLIERSDTFFVASYYVDGEGRASEGADVSHRGGKPGFVRVDGQKTLTIPDYLGNNHFNTLGNILENGMAGLLFIDFESGDVLTMTGKAEVLLESTEADYFSGAERLWRFELIEARWLRSALPLRWRFNDYSANTTFTGTWEEASLAERVDKQRADFLPYTVSEIVDESSQVKSLYLTADNFQKNSFKAGQFLSIKLKIDGQELIRTYTVSSAPEDEYFRISVKRESASSPEHPVGIVSNFLHDEVSVGEQILCKSPLGSFHLDDDSPRSVVLIAAGVGITPMISMARHVLLENFRTRSFRQITLIAAATNQQQQAFQAELQQLSVQSSGAIRCIWALSRPEKESPPVSYHRGYINKELLQSILPLDDYDFYLCGPSGFMQSQYDLLRELGISDKRVFAEEFGPASLQREMEHISVSLKTSQVDAKAALVSFIDRETNSAVEQHWTQQDGHLLEFAEAHGLTPAYGCRSGQCGSCKVKLISGKVNHHGIDNSLLNDDEVLLCCASPAPNDEEALPSIRLAL